MPKELLQQQIANLVLPVPPSVNAMYKRGFDNIYKTQAVNSFNDEVWVACYSAGIETPTVCPVILDIHFYPANRQSDADNILKSLLDALEG